MEFSLLFCQILFLQTQLEDFIAKEDSKSKSESSSSRKSSLGSPISSDIEANEDLESSEAEDASKESFDDEPEIIEDEIEEIQISSEEKVSDYKKLVIFGSTYPLKFKSKYSRALTRDSKTDSDITS